MPKYNEHEWLDLIQKASRIYNEQRAHRDFQADEVYKFVEWIYKQYGYVYHKPELTNKHHP